MRKKSTYQIVKERSEESGLMMFTLWLTLEQKEFLEKKAKERYLTQSAVLREIIDNYIKREKKKGGK